MHCHVEAQFFYSHSLVEDSFYSYQQSFLRLAHLLIAGQKSSQQSPVSASAAWCMISAEGGNNLVQF